MLHRYRYLIVALAAIALAIAAIVTRRHYDTSPSADQLWPNTSQWAQEQIEAMTLEEKVSQLFSVRAYGRPMDADDPEYQELVDLVEQFGIGGITFFRGTLPAQVALTNDLQSRATIPLLIAQDMEWGPGMRIEEGTTFPRAMALGATRNHDLAYLAGYVTGREARTFGVHHILAPVADVNNNPDNPIINVRSFGEDPRLVSDMASAFARGVQNAGGIATAKHFPGHGDTVHDSHIGLPALSFGMERLDTLETVPFRRLVRNGVMSVMVAHLAFPEVDPEEALPASLSPRVTTGILRDELGFDGLVVTDALDMGGVTSRFSTKEIALRAILAGTDMLLLSEDPHTAREAIVQAVQTGKIPEERIDHALGRILRAKAWLGLHRNRLVDVEQATATADRPDHDALSAEIARRSLTLLGHDGRTLPIEDGSRVLSITLSDSDDPSTGGPFVAELRRNLPRSRIDTLLLNDRAEEDAYASAIQASEDQDLVVVSAFVYVRSGTGRIDLPERQAAFLSQLVQDGPPVVLVSLGNPYVVRDIGQPAAYVAAYGGSEMSQRAAADALTGRAAITGQLPVSIPGRHAFGEGMSLSQQTTRSGYPEEVGLSSEVLGHLDTMLTHAIEDEAFPGAALAVGRYGAVAKMQGYGHYTYDSTRSVTPQSIFDLASLTKVVATTTAAMKLYDEGRLDLDAPVVDYLPAFGQSDKEHIRIRHLLTHTSGLIPFRSYHRMGVPTREALIDLVMADTLVYETGMEMRYSDLGMITMMLVIEAITGQPFDEYAEEHVFEPLSMTRSGFLKSGVGDRNVVPTEYDARFRRRLVQGEVHDEAAWILGGVSGHAGLFSTAEDLARFAYMLVHEGRVGGRPFISPETIRLFTRVQDPQLSTRALGWDTKSPEGYSSAGELFGPRSFGHTGFTGTSLWIDPDTGLFVILLTNRVYPTRDNAKIRDVRPRVANQVYRSILGPAEFILADATPTMPYRPCRSMTC